MLGELNRTSRRERIHRLQGEERPWKWALSSNRMRYSGEPKRDHVISYTRKLQHSPFGFEYFMDGGQAKIVSSSPHRFFLGISYAGERFSDRAQRARDAHGADQSSDGISVLPHGVFVPVRNHVCFAVSLRNAESNGWRCVARCSSETRFVRARGPGGRGGAKEKNSNRNGVQPHDG